MTCTNPTGAGQIAIESIERPTQDATIAGLSALLVDAVESGASVSFLGDLTQSEATAWWRKSLETLGLRDSVLIARDEHGIIGTVQVRACWQPNQRFRGEIMKLLVHRRARGRGLAARLMQAIEPLARSAGLTLLVLDTNAGTTADRLYLRLGWTRVGVIPGYCLLHDGTPGDAAFFYKRLDGSPVG